MTLLGEILDAFTGPPWLNPDWEPSPEWTDADRLQLVAALLELVERDMARGVYSRMGRPNFTSIRHVLYEPPEVLEGLRFSVRLMLQQARAERRADEGEPL